MLIKFWASYEQRLPACCQTVLVLWCAHLRLGDLKPGHHFWKTSIQIHKIRPASSLIWPHLTKYAIILTSILWPWIGFGINKWEEKCAHSPPWKEIWSQFWPFEYAYSYYLICFLAILYSLSFILQGNGACQQNHFQWKAFRKHSKHMVLHHVVFRPFFLLAERIGTPSIYSICIIFVILERKQSTNSIS